ncbi:MAG: acetyltransferase [Candidatus Omnitrophota bacterium]
MIEKNIVLMGAGSVGKVMLEAMSALNSVNRKEILTPLAFVDKAPDKIGTRINGVDVISLEEAAGLKRKDLYFIASVGAPWLRKDIIEGLRKIIPDARFATIAHPSAVIMPGASIGEGVYVGANATVSIECRVMPHAMLNYNVVMGHNCVLGEYSVVSPLCHLAGYVRIGRSTFLGGGVMTYPGVRIGDDCVIGAGVIVPRDVPDKKKIITKPNTMEFGIGDERFNKAG